MNMGENAIELRNVWKIFGGRAGDAMQAIRRDGRSKQEVLEEFDCVIGVADVTIDVRVGEIFCIMGLSGSGKSTLVRHINRLHEPTYGEVRVSGRDVLALSPLQLRQYRNEHISMVFQNFALMPHRSVLENIAMPLEIRSVPKNQRLKIAEQSLEKVSLRGWGHKFAHELSGGMQQRVGLARAIAADTEVLLMDEPFSALDPLIRRQLQREFMQLAQTMNKTTVFITHDLEEAVRIGHRIAIMRDGRIVQIGTPEDIIMQPADDYIAEFVAGISRLKIVRAHSVMQSLGDYLQDHRDISADYQRVSEDTHLDVLIRLMVERDEPVGVEDAAGHTVGIITRSDLLRAIVEGTESDE